MSMTPTVIRSTPLPEGTPHVPVAIVGAGACGLVTALSLRNYPSDPSDPSNRVTEVTRVTDGERQGSCRDG